MANIDTRYLQAAWDRMPENGVLTIQPGTYQTDDTLWWDGKGSPVVLAHGVTIKTTLEPRPAIRLSKCSFPRIIGLRLEAPYNSDKPRPVGLTGMELVNVNYAKLDLDFIHYFHTGIKLIGDGKSCSYNEISFGQIYAERGLVMEAKVGGWVNDIVLRRGKITGPYPGTTFIESLNGLPNPLRGLYCFGVTFEAREACLYRGGVATEVEFHGCYYEHLSAGKMTVEHAKKFRPVFFGGDSSTLTFIEK